MTSTINSNNMFPVQGLKTDNDFDNIEHFVDAFNHQTTIEKELLAANYAYFNYQEALESEYVIDLFYARDNEEEFLKEKLLYLQHLGAKFDYKGALELLGITE